MRVTVTGTTLTIDSAVASNVVFTGDGINFVSSLNREGEDRPAADLVYFLRLTSNSTLNFTSAVTFTRNDTTAIYQTQNGQVINDCGTTSQSEGIRIGD
jgi:hypothetical protein